MRTVFYMEDDDNEDFEEEIVEGGTKLEKPSRNDNLSSPSPVAPTKPSIAGRASRGLPTGLPTSFQSATGFESPNPTSPLSSPSPSRIATDSESSRASESIAEESKNKFDLRKVDLSKINLRKIELKRQLPRIPIGVHSIDLTPVSHLEIIETQATKRRWIGIFIGSLIISILVPSYAFFASSQVQGLLNDERDRHSELDIQIARYAEIDQTLKSEDQARFLLDQAVGMEVDWDRLFSTISAELPLGTAITSVNIVAGGKDTRTAEEVEENVDRPISTSILLNFVSETDVGYSDTLNIMENLSGASNLEISGLTGSAGGYNYSIALNYDTSVLTERFTLEG